jgi:hypothetical protein
MYILQLFLQAVGLIGVGILFIMSLVVPVFYFIGTNKDKLLLSYLFFWFVGVTMLLFHVKGN